MTSKAKKKSATTTTEIARLLFNPPSSARQVRFYHLLVAARKQWFMDALSDALGQLDQDVVKEQIREYVPDDAQKILAAAGLRDEHVFPVPLPSLRRSLHWWAIIVCSWARPRRASTKARRA